MRVSFDTNAWETIFNLSDVQYEPIRAALANRRLEGFICETGFRIEAIRKLARISYFSEPYMDVRCGMVMKDGRPMMHLSIGPDDGRHPGIPSEQAHKLRYAMASGVRLMRGSNWMGLPRPEETRDPLLFVYESLQSRQEREQRQIDVCAQIDQRGVEKAMFDYMGGWNANSHRVSARKFQKGCAEWADGELVGAHIAYRNDVLCTNDFARGAGKSIFDPTNRLWLTAEFGVVFRTVGELVADAGSRR